MTNVTETIDVVAGKSAAVQAFIMHHMADSRAWSWLPTGYQRLPAFLTLHGIMVIGSGLFLVVFLGMACRRPAGVPTGWTNCVEFFVKYIRDEMAIPFLGEEDGRRFTPLLCTFFFYILAMNLLGLIPCLYTATANINVTAGLASFTLFFMIAGALFRNGPVEFMKGFVPPGIPWYILILLVPIEIIGLFIRAAALAIRLFANELAGHLVVFSMLGMLIIYGGWALPVSLLAVLVFIQEVFVAFLQAYIFTLLSAVFIGQRYHPAH